MGALQRGEKMQGYNRWHRGVMGSWPHPHGNGPKGIRHSGCIRVNVRAGGGTERTCNGRIPEPRQNGARPPLDPELLELAAQKAAHNMNDRYPCPDTDLEPDAIIVAMTGQPDSPAHPYYYVARRVNARALDLAHTAGWAAKVKEKVCNACEELLPAEYFGPHRLDRTGLQPTCRECTNARKRAQHALKNAAA